MLIADMSTSDAVDDAAAKILDRLDSGDDGRAGLLRDFLRHARYARDGCRNTRGALTSTRRLRRGRLASGRRLTSRARCRAPLCACRTPTLCGRLRACRGRAARAARAGGHGGLAPRLRALRSLARAPR